MKLLLGGVRKLLGLQMRLREQDCLQAAGRLFTLSQPRPQHQKRLITGGKREGEVKSLCYLFEEMPCQVPQSLAGQVSFQTLQ